MNELCSQCKSPHLARKNIGKKTRSVIGTMAGAASGAAGVINGAELVFNCVS